MNMVEAPELEVAAVKAVAARLNGAIERGRHKNRKLSRTIQSEVDSVVGIGPPHLPLPFSLVILAVLLGGGIGGFLWAAVARNWWSCALFAVLTILGVFLLDQVRLMQRRDTALKTGLYLDATSRKVSE